MRIEPPSESKQKGGGYSPINNRGETTKSLVSERSKRGRRMDE